MNVGSDTSILLLLLDFVQLSFWTYRSCLHKFLIVLNENKTGQIYF